MESRYQVVNIHEDYDEAAGQSITNWTKYIEDIKKANGLKHLQLHNVTLDEHIEKWCDLIIQNAKDLLHLNISFCYMTTDVFDKLLDALQQCDSITSLFINDKEPIESEQFYRLAEIIVSKPHITELSLWRVPIDDIQHVDALCSIIKANQLTKLTISECFDFATAYPNFITRIFDALEQNNTLEYLAGNNLRLENVGTVHLAEWLEKSTSIKTLCISNNYIEDDGFKALFEALSKNKSLEDLYMDYNCLGHNACEFIADALKQNNTLICLHINIDTSTSTSLQLIGDALKVNNTLTELWINFSSSKITEGQTDKYFLEMLQSNTALTSIYINHQKPSQQMEVELERNKQLRIYHSYYAIIIRNIARRNEAFELFPAEIWLLIFGHLKLRNMVQRIFKLYNRPI